MDRLEKPALCFLDSRANLENTYKTVIYSTFYLRTVSFGSG